MAIETSESLKEHALTYAERLELKGLKKGIGQGLAAALVRQLRRRFPDEVGPEVEARVQAASPQVVEVWLDRILTEPTIEVVLSPIDK